MARNKDTTLIWATILETITETDNSTPHARLFNLIHKHFQTKHRVLTYKQFIAYTMSSMSGRIDKKDLFKQWEKK